MKAESKRYFIRVQKILVEVTGEVYTAYYEMERKEKYLLERDKDHSLLYYDGWDTETSNGVDFIKDNKTNVEEEAIKNLLPGIWSYAEKIGDKYHICQLIASGKTEKEIAEICKVTQQTVNETKLRLLKS